jgi:hypothetical protein
MLLHTNTLDQSISLPDHWSTSMAGGRVIKHEYGIKTITEYPKAIDMQPLF